MIWSLLHMYTQVCFEFFFFKETMCTTDTCIWVKCSMSCLNLSSFARTDLEFFWFYSCMAKFHSLFISTFTLYYSNRITKLQLVWCYFLHSCDASHGSLMIFLQVAFLALLSQLVKATLHHRCSALVTAQLFCEFFID